MKKQFYEKDTQATIKDIVDAGLLRRADKAYNAGDLENAIVNVELVLFDNPKHQEAKSRLDSYLLEYEASGRSWPTRST